MKIQSTPTIRYKCQNSANNHESRQPVSFGLNFIKLAKEVPLKKEQKIIEVLKKIIKTFAKNPRPVAGKLKTVEKPLIAPALESPADFAKRTAANELKNQAYGSNINAQYSQNYEILMELKRKGVPIPDAAWDAPITDSGILTDSAYNTIVQNIQDSNFEDYKKDEIIKKLKRINFKGKEDSFINPSHFDDIDLTDHIDIEPDVIDAGDYLDVLHDHIKDFGEHLLDALKEIIGAS
jgi:hypothetical protein